MGSVALVLVVACANVAGLLIARNAARTREFAVRIAFGASRWHLAAQTLTDALVIAAIGGALGLGVAYVALPLLVTSSPTAIVRLADARVDLGVAATAIGISAIATLIVGLIPAIQFEGRSVVERLKSTSTGQIHQSLPHRTRAVLVVGQIAVTVILLVGGALAFQSFRRLAALDLGYRPAHVVSANISQLDQTRYAGFPALLRATEEIIRGVSSLPDVQSAAGVLVGPFGHGVIGWDSGVLVEGQPDTPTAWTANPSANVEAVTPRYFETMGIRRLGGRDFTTADRANTPRVAIVSDVLAAHLWPGQNPIGKRLRSSLIEGGLNRPAQWQTVVGVVGAARYREIDGVRDDLYVPLAQGWDGAIENVVARVSGDPRALVQPIGAVLSTVDPQLNARNVTTLSEIVGRVQMPWRFNMLLFGGFGFVAIGLTTVALVGLIAATVSWRRREIGVRVALGAQRAQVVHVIVRQGVRLVLAGIALGLVGALGATRLLSSLLFDVGPHDPLALVTGCAAVLGLGVLACYLPARRAASVDPSVVFRDE